MIKTVQFFDHPVVCMYDGIWLKIINVGMHEWVIGKATSIYHEGPLEVSMKISLCTEKGTSKRFFVTKSYENHIISLFNPILDIPKKKN